jgi:porin
VYNGDPTLGANDKHGVDWTMRGPLFAIGEVGVHLDQGLFATGLPGNYKIGGYYQAGNAPDLYRDVNGGSIALSGLPPQMHSGKGGFYILLDQMIYRDGGADSRRGLTPFVSLLFAPDSSVNTMPFFANGGLVYQGLFSSRPRDTAAVGVAYGAFSRQLARSQRDARRAGSGAGIQQYEVALELTYIIQARRWLQVQPDLQYIINPGGTGKIRDALVLGFQLALIL